MSYKTILLHLADDASHAARIDAAVDLAGRFQAHVTALYIATPVSMPAEIEGRGASRVFIEQATERAREKAKIIAAKLTARMGAKNLSFEWRNAEGDHLDLLAEAAIYADLTIVSHSRAELIEDRVVFHVPEHLPLVAACPVVILPADGFPATFAHHVLIAWKPCIEAARAVNLSLPLLKQAEKITILSIVPEPQDDPPCAKLGKMLRRHGIEAAIVADELGTRYAGEAILEHARNMRADALVMGAYGHSRLREMVLGGVTRNVLMNAKIPLLLAH